MWEQLAPARSSCGGCPSCWDFIRALTGPPSQLPPVLPPVGLSCWRVHSASASGPGPGLSGVKILPPTAVQTRAPACPAGLASTRGVSPEACCGICSKFLGESPPCATGPALTQTWGHAFQFRMSAQDNQQKSPVVGIWGKGPGTPPHRSKRGTLGPLGPLVPRGVPHALRCPHPLLSLRSGVRSHGLQVLPDRRGSSAAHPTVRPEGCGM